MTVSTQVTLGPLAAGEQTLLGNLFELYLHDMSEIFPLRLGSDGRFGYDELPLYMARSATHIGYLVRANAEVAGFALATRGSCASSDPDVFDVAHFFVLRAWRRHGVGRVAACLLWDRMPGSWIVRVSELNRAGLPFWEGVVRSYTRGAFQQSQHPGKSHMFQVFALVSPRAHEGGAADDVGSCSHA